MTQSKLIKRAEAVQPKKNTPRLGTTPRAIVREWVNQYQLTSQRNARAAFEALFTTAQLG